MNAQSESLDERVARAREALAAHRCPTPQALFLLATGAGFLPERLRDAHHVPLAEIPGVPAPWTSAELIAGDLGGLVVWVLDDLSSEASALAATEHWPRGFPVWLAAAAGARLLVHSSAGAALLDPESQGGPRLGSLCLVSDHLNLSGRTPLRGLGSTRLGPLFPDQSRLHDRGYRELAARTGARLGLDLEEVIAACTAGPTLDTPAERRFYARAGAQVAVQGLEAPLIAAAHAGLSTLAIVALTDLGERADLRRLLERSAEAAPALEDLLEALGPALAGALEAREEAGHGA